MELALASPDGLPITQDAIWSRLTHHFGSVHTALSFLLDFLSVMQKPLLPQESVTCYIADFILRKETLAASIRARARGFRQSPLRIDLHGLIRLGFETDKPEE